MNEIPIGEKIVKNTFFNILSRFFNIFINFLLTPYILYKLGIERFGIWALLTAMMNYFSILDMGLGTSYLKFISEYYAKGEKEKINQIVNTGFGFYFLISLMVLILALFLKNFIFKILNFPLILEREINLVYYGIVVVFFINAIFSGFLSIIDGLQKMDISSKIKIFLNILNLIGVIYFLEKGYKLEGLIVNTLILSLISVIIYLFYAFKIFPELRFNLKLFNKEIFNEMFSFGSKIQVTNILWLLYFHFDKLLLAHFLGMVYVGFYELGYRIAILFKSFPELLLSALLPAVSELNILSDKAKLIKLIERGTSYLVMISLPIAVFLFFNANSIIKLWVGNGYDKSVLAAKILALGYLLNVTLGILGTVGRGLGKPQYEALNCIFGIFGKIILSIILVIKLGFTGVLFSNLIILSLGYFWYIWQFNKYILFWKEYLKIIKYILFKPLFLMLVPFSFVFFISKLLSFFNNLSLNFISLFIEGIIFAILCILFFKKYYLSSDDLMIIKEYIKKAFIKK